MEWIDIKSGILPKEDCEVFGRASSKYADDNHFILFYRVKSNMFCDDLHEFTKDRNFKDCRYQLRYWMKIVDPITPPVIKEEEK